MTDSLRGEPRDPELSRILECSICLAVQTRMVKHLTCATIACVNCFVEWLRPRTNDRGIIINDGMTCHMCRKSVRTTRYSNILEVSELTSTERQMSDKLKYKCNRCLQYQANEAMATHACHPGAGEPPAPPVPPVPSPPQSGTSSGRESSARGTMVVSNNEHWEK